MKANLFLFLIFFLPVSLLAQDNELLNEAWKEEIRGNYSSAIHLNEQIAHPKSGISAAQCQAYLNLGRLYEITGDLEKSKLNINSSDSINQALKNDTLSIKISFSLGHYDLVFERNEMARKHFEEALAMSKTLGHQNYVAHSYTHISSVFHQLGEYLKALEYINQAKVILEKDPTEKLALAIIHKKTGDNYYLLHQVEESKIEYEQSIKIASTIYSPAHDFILRLHNDLGAVNSDLGNIEESRLHLNQTVSQEERIGANHSIADAYYYLSLLELSEENAPLSINYAKKSLGLFKSIYGLTNYWVCSGWVNLADMYYYSGDLKSAANTYHRAFLANDSTFSELSIELNPNYETAISSVYYIVTMMEKAKTLLEIYTSEEEEKYLIASYQAYLSLLNAVKQQRLAYGASKIQLEFGEDISEIYANALRCNYHLYEKTQNNKFLVEAVSIAEQGKAYYLSLTRNRNELGNWIKDNESKLLMEYKEKEKTGILSFEEQREYDELLSKLRANNPEIYLRLFNVESFDLLAAQKEWIKKDEMLLEYLIGNEGIHILGITRDSIRHVFKMTDYSTDSLVTSFRRSILERNSPELLKQASFLFKLLIEPVSIPEEIKILKIIPDQRLHYLPFEALVSGIENNKLSSDTRFLIKDYTISYLHSALLGFSYFKKIPASGQRFVGFAPSYSEHDLIPASIKEVKSIARLTNGTAFTGSRASVENLKNEIDKAGILHFSSHAIVNDEEPSKSYLVLRSDTSENDIKLYSHQIGELKLNTGMVTLSSCNTGIGTLKGGEGVLSLARDFALAGSPSIVMSLWPATDLVSSEIMVNFYKRLKEGDTKSNAIRQAKLTFLENSDNISSHPYFWANMVLIGNEDPVNLKRKISIYWWTILLFIPVIAIYLRLNKNLRN